MLSRSARGKEMKDKMSVEKSQPFYTRYISSSLSYELDSAFLISSYDRQQAKVPECYSQSVAGLKTSNETPVMNQLLEPKSSHYLYGQVPKRMSGAKAMNDMMKRKRKADVEI